MKRIIAVLLIVCMFTSIGYMGVLGMENNMDLISTTEPFAEAVSCLSNVTNQAEVESEKYYLSIEPSQRLFVSDNFDNVTYNLTIGSLNEYDYININFVTTEAVTLSDYADRNIDYSEQDTSFSLTFNVDKSIVNDGIELDYHLVEFEEIKVFFDIYSEKSLKQTVTVSMTLMINEHGVWGSTFDGLFIYEEYIDYLKEHELITQNEYKKAQKRMTETIFVYKGDYDKEKAEKEIEEHFNTNRLLKYYNKQTNSVDCVSESEINKKQITLSGDSTISLSQATNPITRETFDFNRTIITVSSTITPIYEGTQFPEATQLRVSGEITWTDINGNNIPAYGLNVEIVDEDVLVDDVKASVYTSSSGRFSATIENDLIENGCDIYLKINMKTNDFQIKREASSDDYYVFTTETMDDITTLQSKEDWKFVGEVVHEAIYIHQALVIGYSYYKAMNDTVHNIDVIFSSKDNFLSYSSSASDKIELRWSDFCDWDVILHELGHQVARNIGVYSRFGQEHSDDQCLACRYDKSKGINGAWNEGWASYFSISAQHFCVPGVGGCQNVPGVMNNSYENISITGKQYTINLGENYLTCSAIGETNEKAVTAFLLRLINNDNLGFYHQDLWDLIKDSQCSTFSEFVAYLYQNVDNSKLPYIGEEFEKLKISAKPQKSSDKIYYCSSTGSQTFCWNGIGNKDSDACDCIYQYALTFWDTNCNKLYQSAWTTNESISISSSVWMSIVSGANDGKLFWAVATRQNDNPTTGPYYSGFRECLLSDNVTTMENVFRSLRCSFTDGVSELWFKVSITEDAYYSIFSTGNIDVEGSIYVLGSDNILTKLGNNPPTYYTKTDNNFDIARELTSGTTYYIRVQANDNTAGSCVLNIRTHISISSFDIEHQGYFDEEGYVMYRMRLTSGRYAIYTTGSTDTYIQVQDTPVTCWSDFNDAILYDDDSGRDTNACVIISCTSIQYIYIIVKGYSETTYGDFGLVVVPTQNVTSLDTSYRNSLEEAELDWYSFTAAQSGTYAFYASGAIDTYADLFDFYEPNGGIDYVVTSNDDGDSLYNTSINFCILYEMDAGETVYIRARAFDNTTTGDYNFYVSKYQ